MTLASLVQRKGQVTIPLQARSELGLKAGDEVVWVRNRSGRWEIRTLKDLVAELDPLFASLGEWSRKVRRSYGVRRP